MWLIHVSLCLEEIDKLLRQINTLQRAYKKRENPYKFNSVYIVCYSNWWSNWGIFLVNDYDFLLDGIQWSVTQINPVTVFCEIWNSNLKVNHTNLAIKPVVTSLMYKLCNYKWITQGQTHTRTLFWGTCYPCRLQTPTDGWVRNKLTHDLQAGKTRKKDRRALHK
jgi:hypothetical protein